jgi:hypothetical protein
MLPSPETYVSGIFFDVAFIKVGIFAGKIEVNIR